MIGLAGCVTSFALPLKVVFVEEEIVGDGEL
jgi:hypothetical protein